MAEREEKSLLPTSLPVKREKVKRGRFPLKRAFRWLHVLTTGLLVCWFGLITLKSWRSDANRMLPEEVIRQLMNNEEVRELKFYLVNIFYTWSLSWRSEMELPKCTQVYNYGKALEE